MFIVAAEVAGGIILAVQALRQHWDQHDSTAECWPLTSTPSYVCLSFGLLEHLIQLPKLLTDVKLRSPEIWAGYVSKAEQLCWLLPPPRYSCLSHLTPRLEPQRHLFVPWSYYPINTTCPPSSAGLQYLLRHDDPPPPPPHRQNRIEWLFISSFNGIIECK